VYTLVRMRACLSAWTHTCVCTQIFIEIFMHMLGGRARCVLVSWKVFVLTCSRRHHPALGNATAINLVVL